MSSSFEFSFFSGADSQGSDMDASISSTWLTMTWPLDASNHDVLPDDDTLSAIVDSLLRSPSPTPTPTESTATVSP
jgi:hypothetical protein